MKIIGLTGPSGAGKGAVSALFRKLYGIPAIDTDHVYHQLLLPPSDCLNELAEAFGKDILAPNGTLCRPRLAEIVFSDETRKKQMQLNAITHRYVLEKTERILKNYQKDQLAAVIVDAPLLFEANFDKLCDCYATISVLAPEEIRKQRIIVRDGLTESQAERRLHMQKPDAYYKERSTFSVVNAGDMAELEKQVTEIAQKLGVST